MGRGGFSEAQIAGCLYKNDTESKAGDRYRRHGTTDFDPDVAERFDLDTNTCLSDGTCGSDFVFRQATGPFMALTVAGFAPHRGTGLAPTDRIAALPQAGRAT